MSAVADVMRGWSLPAEQVAVEFSDHAVAQANKRVFRHLDLEFAASEASALLADAIVRTAPPEWLTRKTLRARAWLISAKWGVAFALDYKNSRDGDREVFYATTALSQREDAPVGAEVTWKE